MAVEVDAATKEEDDGPRGRGSKDNIGGRRGRKTRVMNLQLERRTTHSEEEGEKRGRTRRKGDNRKGTRECGIVVAGAC